MSSAEQDQWTEIAECIRAGLAKLAPLIPAMKIEEISAFVKTCDDAMWLETKAKSHDIAVEERDAVLRRQAQFGG